MQLFFFLHIYIAINIAKQDARLHYFSLFFFVHGKWEGILFLKKISPRSAAPASCKTYFPLIFIQALQVGTVTSNVLSELPMLLEMNSEAEKGTR